MSIRVVVSYTAQDVADYGLGSEWVNDATVIFSLTRNDGTPYIVDMPLPYLAGTDGVYRNNIPATTGILLGEAYQYEVVVTDTESQPVTVRGDVTVTNDNGD
jgi:hypothetical protein